MGEVANRRLHQPRLQTNHQTGTVPRRASLARSRSARAMATRPSVSAPSAPIASPQASAEGEAAAWQSGQQMCLAGWRVAAELVDVGRRAGTSVCIDATRQRFG